MDFPHLIKMLVYHKEEYLTCGVTRSRTDVGDPVNTIFFSASSASNITYVATLLENLGKENRIFSELQFASKY